MGREFPMDPVEQLWGATEAVWRSWMLKKAVDYRRATSADTIGTAVSVVSMAFGDMGDDSGTRVGLHA
ncbi:MAG: PEP/pyruvate-binding domain-containing protein [Gemmatimonadaceae bacterium]|nr:PEP/pyruvate-binding domain-containing protein [Gemmatimonadaceae bacterium]